MAATLDFNVNVNTNSVVSSVAQLSSQLQQVLQGTISQMGAMSGNIANTAAMGAAYGANPYQLGLAHTLNPVATQYEMSRRAFEGRVAGLVEFVAGVNQAAVQRAQSISSSLDYSAIVPKLAGDSRGISALKVLGGGLMDMAFSIGGFALGNLIPGVGPVAGLALSHVGTMISGWLKKKVGLDPAGGPASGMTQEEYQAKIEENKRYADFASLFMALGPQKNLPRFGASLNKKLTEANIAVTKDFLERFKKYEDDTILATVLRENPAFFASTMGMMSLFDPERTQQIIQGIGKYTGVKANKDNKIADHVIDLIVSGSKGMMNAANLYGFASYNDPVFQQMVAIWSTKKSPFYDKYTMPKPPDWLKMMTGSIGEQLQVGKDWGAGFGSSIRDRIYKSLSLSSKEREWLGGTKRIAQMYAGIVMKEASTFGSRMTLEYAAAASGRGYGRDVYATAAAASEILSDPAKFIEFKLGYKNILQKTGGGAADALYRKQMIQTAKEWVINSGGAIKNEYDALRLIYEGMGMTPEQARAQAGMVLDYGVVVSYSGGGSERVALSNYALSDAALKNVREKFITGLKDEFGEKKASEMFDRLVRQNIWKKDIVEAFASISAVTENVQTFENFQKDVKSGKLANWAGMERALKKLGIDVNDISRDTAVSLSEKAHLSLAAMHAKDFRFYKSSSDNFGLLENLAKAAKSNRSLVQKLLQSTGSYEAFSQVAEQLNIRGKAASSLYEELKAAPIHFNDVDQLLKDIQSGRKFYKSSNKNVSYNLADVENKLEVAFNKLKDALMEFVQANGSYNATR